MLEPQFYDWFNATIAVEGVLGSSSGGYGGRKLVASVNVLARLEQFIKDVKSHDGDDVQSRGRIFASAVDTTGAAVTITPSTRLTIPAGYIQGTTTQPRIVNVEQHNDEDGDPAYFEVLV